MSNDEDIRSQSDSDRGSESEADHYEEIQRLRERNLPVPRRLRTHNLRFTEDYCTHWGPEAGIREILQNFFDGLASAFNVKPADIQYVHETRGGPGKKRWNEVWAARPKGFKGPERDGTEYGTITHNKRSGMLIVMVCCHWFSLYFFQLHFLAQPI